MSERAFASIPLNARSGKPRSRGITEIRGPYYTVMGRRYLEDILDTMHPTSTDSSSPAAHLR
jgi:phosphosulfolactate synthase (CoM biosynthesis protein A)